MLFLSNINAASKQLSLQLPDILLATNFEMTGGGGREEGDQKWFLELPRTLSGS